MYKLHRPYHYVANAELLYFMILCDLINISSVYWPRHDKIFVTATACTDTKVQQNIFLRKLHNSGHTCFMVYMGWVLVIPGCSMFVELVSA
jgi:hypothetical protein